MKITIYILITILSLFIIGGSTSYAKCDPNRNCTVCIAHKPRWAGGGCIAKADNPLCIAARNSCRGCLIQKMVEAGATYQCASCIIGAITTGGAVAVVCAGICGGAAAVERANAIGGCEGY